MPNPTVILSIDLIDGGPSATLRALRARPRAASVPGLVWAQTALTVPLAAGLFPPPRPTGAARIAAWTGDAALDAFLEREAPARRGWGVRLEPLRASGAWSAVPQLSGANTPHGDDELVAVLTLGRLKLNRAVPFFRATGRAERQAVADPALLLSTAMARPPRLVATFSVWRTAAEVRAYAYGGTGEEHVSAIRAHRQAPFHHESLFARFRPYAEHGSWRGLRPLAGQSEARA